MLVPILLGIAHAIVDASTVTAVMRATHWGPASAQAAFGLVLGYDLIAFGSQVIFGWLTDRYAAPRLATLLGLALAALSLALHSIDPIATVACAGIGNALFHLGAGATVLRCGLERAAPSGVYVAPGALGLAFGMFYGAAPERGPVWPLLVMSVTALVGLTVWRNRGALQAAGARTIERTGCAAPRLATWAVALLLLSITVRSLVGMSAARGYERTELLLIGLPCAAFLGKSVGGFLADRLGWIETGVVALVLSVPLIAIAQPTVGLIGGLFVFQMTMPVTLVAVARLMPNRLATAFGWTCLALIVGALPTMFSASAPLCNRALLGVWILAGAASLYGGLRLLGIQHRFAFGPTLSARLEPKS